MTVVFDVVADFGRSVADVVVDFILLVVDVIEAGAVYNFGTVVVCAVVVGLWRICRRRRENDFVWSIQNNATIIECTIF